ncbi:glycine--tRNA ligase subunit beta [Porticoccaceae bacterium LTM1]|nr:glycine--tRNA ligase subunit beta [Porticoccaceae bacterium LTM1]
MSADFLVEIGTEELPPKSLLQLSTAFHDAVVKGLADAQLSFEGSKAYASPRRLAVLVSSLAEQAPTQEIVAWGPPAKIAFDAEGKPAKAAEAFAAKNGISTDELKVENDGKQDKLCYRANQEGAKAADCVEKIIDDALKSLPIAKRMRWGAARTEFVRPMHWLVVIHGDNVIDANVMGIQSGRTTRGHRIHSAGDITITAPASYLEQLKSGYVMADFAERRELIRQQVEAAAKDAGGHAVIDADLLDEVTALNEWPTALLGRFEERFLDVPAEALISSMKEHQKYFHVLDDNGKLMPLFITVANIESKDPAQVVAGNEKVIRPRLADAAFFYETDKKNSLESRRKQLQKIVFQAQLGTIFDKTERVAKLAEWLAPHVNAEPANARRAGELSKSDLVSEMVLEFTDLQGLMGRYYAQHDGEHDEVAQAMYEQYLPRFAGDSLPTTATGTTLALADRIDTLVGIFGIGMTPTGSKDPFALRRASLGVLRLLIENKIDLDLRDVLTTAANLYRDLPQASTVVKQVLTYMTERFRAMYSDQGIATEVFMAVAAKQLSNPLDIDQRVNAVQSFTLLEEAAALAAANKRVSNILAKLDENYEAGQVNDVLLQEAAEKALATTLNELDSTVRPQLQARDYTAGMKALAALRAPVDTFFDDVMVMAEDEALRNNRIALLSQLRSLFLEVADISLLVPAK